MGDESCIARRGNNCADKPYRTTQERIRKIDARRAPEDDLYGRNNTQQGGQELGRTTLTYHLIAEGTARGTHLRNRQCAR